MDDPILEAYARYDSDPRVNGIDDMEAFRDAVLPLVGIRRLVEPYTLVSEPVNGRRVVLANVPPDVTVQMFAHREPAKDECIPGCDSGDCQCWVGR